MPITLSPAEKAEAVFLDLVKTAAPAALAEYPLVPAMDYDPENEPGLPFVLFDSGRKETTRRPQPGVHDVFLKVFVTTDATKDQDATGHSAAVAAILNTLNDRDSIRSTVNAAGGFQLYDYFLDGQITRQIDTGEWETELTLRIVCQLR